jgi:hypothetical protein
MSDGHSYMTLTRNIVFPYKITVTLQWYIHTLYLKPFRGISEVEWSSYTVGYSVIASN